MDKIDNILENIKNAAKTAGVSNTQVVQQVPVSFCIIYGKEDEHLLDTCTEMMPDGSEICLLETVPGKEESYQIAIKETYDQKRKITIKHGQWHYKKIIGGNKRSGFSFSKAKNHCIDMATRKLVWIVDSDERIQWIQKDMDMLFAMPDDCGGFYVTINSNWLPEPGKKTGLRNPEPQVRIFLNKPEIRFIGRCHEQIAKTIREAGYNIYDTPLQVQHMGYYGVSIEKLQYKLERNIDLLIQDIYEYPEKVFNLSFLYHHLKDAVKNGWLPELDFESHKFQDA